MNELKGQTIVPLSSAVRSAVKSKKCGGGSVRKVAATKNMKKIISADHPLTSVMVNNALKSLKDRGGSSLQAIKKYICKTYKVDPEKISPLIKKYLKLAVSSGHLNRTKGTGACGSFKLAMIKGAKAKNPKKAVPKPKTAKGDVLKSKSSKPKAKRSTKGAASSAKKSLNSTSKTPVVKKLKVKAKKPAVKKMAKKCLARK